MIIEKPSCNCPVLFVCFFVFVLHSRSAHSMKKEIKASRVVVGGARIFNTIDFHYWNSSNKRRVSS